MCFIQWIKNNWIELIALTLSIVSLIFSFIRYKGQLATIIKRFRLHDIKGYKYNARINLKNKDEQIQITGIRLFKKKKLFYRYYKDHEIFEVEYQSKPITGYYDIDLNGIKKLSPGKYKLLIFFNRRPKKLKLKFKLPI